MLPAVQQNNSDPSWKREQWTSIHENTQNNSDPSWKRGQWTSIHENTQNNSDPSWKREQWTSIHEIPAGQRYPEENDSDFFTERDSRDLQFILAAVFQSPSSRDAGLLLRLLICELAQVWEKEEQLWDFLLCLFKIVFWSPHQHFLVL